jgi:Lysozyme like domain
VIYSLGQLQALAASVGFPDPALAAAVAMAESGGDSCANGDPHNASGCSSDYNSTSFGLWQIHVTAHPQYNSSQLKNDANYNALAALAISSQGTNWTPWSTYNSGKYKRWYSGPVPPPAPVVRPVLAPPGSTPALVLGGLLGLASVALLARGGQLG